MQLKMITAETCPTCGSATVMDRCERHHINGEGFESRQYACDHLAEWSPNFKCLVICKPCPESSGEKLIKKNREKARQKVLVLIEKLNVDEAWKEKLVEKMYWDR